MSIEKITYVHEFLARFDRTGFKAAHIARAVDMEEDGVLMPGQTKLLDPQPVTADDATTLAQISDVINAVALADNAAKDAQIAQMTADHEAALNAATDAKTAAEAARDAALAQVDALNARIAELQPPAIDGVPQEVTMRQAQLALLGAGLLDAVEAAIDAIPDATQRRAAQITWSKSADVMRSNPLIAGLQGALGLTDAQIDALFVAASKL